MIKTRLFDTIPFTLALLTTVIVFPACNNGSKSEDSKEVAEARNEPKKDPTSEKDERFLVNAAEISLEDVQLGQLAQQKGNTEDVKSLGKMMEDAHKKTMMDVTRLANSHAIAIPTTPTDNAKDAYKKLNEKTGLDFDKEYCDMMVKGHKDAIDIFEKASSDCEDAEIKTWAANSLSGLRTHLTQAEACQNKLKEMK